MLPIDTLLHITIATISLGTFHEDEGIKSGEFWIRNEGTEAVELKQGYTSCGCVKLDFELGRTVQPGDSTLAVLSFNPKGKGGEFIERGCIVYGEKRKRIEFALEGNCISSEETILRQYPIFIDENIYMSADHFDLGNMMVGERKSRTIVVIHRDENNRCEYFSLDVYIDSSMTKGVQRIEKQLSIRTKKGVLNVPINFLVKVL